MAHNEKEKYNNEKSCGTSQEAPDLTSLHDVGYLVT